MSSKTGGTGYSSMSTNDLMKLYQETGNEETDRNSSLNTMYKELKRRGHYIESYWPHNVDET